MIGMEGRRGEGQEQDQMEGKGEEPRGEIDRIRISVPLPTKPQNFNQKGATAVQKRVKIHRTSSSLFHTKISVYLLPCPRKQLAWPDPCLVHPSSSRLDLPMLGAGAPRLLKCCILQPLSELHCEV